MESLDLNHIRKIYSIHDYLQSTTILIIYILLLFYIIPREYSNGYIDDLFDNWNMNPIVDFHNIEKKENDSTPFFLNDHFSLGSWDGIVKSCNCLNLNINKDYDNKLIRKKCSKKMIKNGCNNIPKIYPVSYKSWKGVYLNPIRSNHSYSYIDYFYHFSYEQCGKGLKDCGYIDTNLIFKLCLSKDEECPINHIYVDKKEKSNSNYNYKTFKLNDDYYFHYTNEKENGAIIVQLKISELLPCANPNYDNRKEMEYELYSKKEHNCKDEIEDYRYNDIDFENKSTLYFENGIDKIIENLPSYQIKDTSVQLFHRGYLSLEKKVKMNQDYLAFFEYYKFNIYANNALRLFMTSFCGIFVSLSMKNNEKRGGNNKMFKSDLIVRSVIEIVIFILIYDTYLIFDYGRTYFNLLNYVSPITKMGIKKIINNIEMFMFLDFFILGILCFVCIFNPFFLLSETIAKIFPSKKKNMTNNNSSVAIDMMANQIGQNVEGFDKIKQKNIENSTQNHTTKEGDNHISEKYNENDNDNNIEEKPENNI